MGLKLHLRSDNHLVFSCPGCRHNHAIPIVGAKRWEWNKSYEHPTLTPSVNYRGKCHFHVMDGRLLFQQDCSHDLAGQIVEMPDWGSPHR